MVALALLIGMPVDAAHLTLHLVRPPPGIQETTFIGGFVVTEFVEASEHVEELLRSSSLITGVVSGT